MGYIHSSSSLKTRLLTLPSNVFVVEVDFLIFLRREEEVGDLRREEEVGDEGFFNETEHSSDSPNITEQTPPITFVSTRRFGRRFSKANVIFDSFFKRNAT